MTTRRVTAKDVGESADRLNRRLRDRFDVHYSIEPGRRYGYTGLDLYRPDGAMLDTLRTGLSTREAEGFLAGAHAALDVIERQRTDTIAIRAEAESLGIDPDIVAPAPGESLCPVCGVRAGTIEALTGEWAGTLVCAGCLPGILRDDRLSASGALDQIADLLSGSEWDADTIGMIASVIRDTGRLVEDVEDVEEDVEEPAGDDVEAVKIRTDDAVTVTEGDRVFNYYDMRAGTIVPGSVTENGGDLWFDVEHDDGKRAILNGQRIVSIGFATSRGWVTA